MTKKNKLSYWERRQVQNMYGYMEQAEKAADQVAKVYLKSSRYLSLQADEIFEKYQTKHGLSENEARRLINTLQDKTSLDELLQKLRSSEPSKDKKELLQRLEAPAYQARLERLRQLQNQLDQVMQSVYQQEKLISTDFYTNLAEEAYYRTIHDTQQRVNAAFSFQHISPKQIDQVINSKWSGKNYSTRIWGNTQALAADLKEELLINLITGRSNREAAEIIANKFGQGASNARRLVRTESNYVATEMNFKAYEECGVEKYLFLATLDLRTSIVCRGLDGKIYLVSERKTGKNCPPMHPWCRSTTISVIDEALLSKLQRSAIDPVTGKRIKVPLTMTYDQWYDKYVKGKPAAEAEERKYKNQYADRKQYEKYRAIMPDKVPESFAKFQDLKYNNSEKWNEIKSGKQDALNQRDFKDMSSLVGKLGDKEARLWYKAKMNEIPEKINTNQALELQAREAHTMRNDVRTQTRELMADQEQRRHLDATRPNKSFEEILRHKIEDKHLTKEQAISDIIKTSTKTNKQVDDRLGLE